jgi:hypothetical protein
MVAAVNKDTMTLTKAAMTAFVAYWEENATNAELMEVESGGKPEFRNAQTATEMVFNYIEERKHTLCRSDFELLDIERPFAVPLDPENPSLIYIGRWDKIFRYQGRIYIGEHKTTSLYKREGPFQNSFVESFSPNSQIDGYLYAGMMEYGRDLKAVWVDAALVHRDVHDGFRFIPVERQFAQIETWLWETTYWINQIEANKSVYGSLAHIPASDRAKLEYLPAFPKNTVSCTQYGGCPYLDLCKMWANPDRHPTPLGFVEEKWEPFDELKIARSNIALVGKADRADVTPGNDKVYDNTRTSEFRTCPRKFYYRHIRDWRPGEDRRPLLFGGAWHAAMDVVWEVLCDRRNRTMVAVGEKNT